MLPLRIVFMGTPDFAVPTLEMMIAGGYNVVAVVTQPDKPVGRHGNTLVASPVKQCALAHGLPVLQPERMKDPQFVEQLRSYHANLQVVVAFRMLPEVVWAMPEYGTFNVHAALLPQYRGAAPINWAVINGETRTGVTTFFLDHQIDTGRIILQKPFDIRPEYNVEDVYEGLMTLGAAICKETLEMIVEAGGQPASLPQSEYMADGTVLHPAPKIFKETCRIDVAWPAARVHNFVRGLSPAPGAWCMIADAAGHESVLKLFKTSLVADTGGANSGSPDGSLRVSGRDLLATFGGQSLKIEELQPAGRKRMPASAWLNGAKDVELCRLK